jgi:hypothetical protein
MWQVFTLCENNSRAEEMWRYIPMSWRGAWLGAFHEIGPEFKSVTRDYLEPSFKDQTEDVDFLANKKCGSCS